MKADGTTVLLSSHLLDRVQEVCARVALFSEGKIALEGTVPQLALRVLSGGFIYEVEVEAGDLVPVLTAVPGARRVVSRPAGRVFVTKRSTRRRRRAGFSQVVLCRAGAGTNGKGKVGIGPACLFGIIRRDPLSTERGIMIQYLNASGLLNGVAAGYLIERRSKPDYECFLIFNKVTVRAAPPD